VAELGFRPHGWDFSPFIPFRPVDLSIDRYYPPQSAPCGEFPLPTAVDLWWRFLGIFYFSVRLALGLLSGCSVAWIPYQHRWIKHLWSVVLLSFSIHSGREHFIRSFGISARYDFSLILRFEPEGEWFYLCRSRFPFLFFLIFLPPSHCNSCFWPVILLLRFVFLGVRFFGVHRLNREPHLTHIHGNMSRWSNVWKLRSMGRGRAMVLFIPWFPPKYPWSLLIAGHPCPSDIYAMVAGHEELIRRRKMLLLG
jgi:hypothetical protein